MMRKGHVALAPLLLAAIVAAEEADRPREPLTLPEAKRIALTENPTLKAAEARVWRAREALVAARSAYWPTISLSASATRLQTSENAYSPLMGIDNPEEAYGAGATASWIVFDGLARNFAAAAARHGEAATIAARRDAERLLLAGVASAYLGAELARERIRIAEADRAFFRRLYENARARRREQAGSLSDEMSFEIQANTAEANLITARRDYEVARHALAAVLGLPGAMLPDGMDLAPLPAATDEDLATPDIDAAIALAEAQRPDLAGARRAIEGADAGTDTARAAYLPTVTLQASTSAERYGGAALEDDDLGSTIALVLSYDIFDGGRRRAALRDARALAVAADAALETTQLAVHREVRTAATDVVAAQRQLKLQRRNGTLARTNRDQVKHEYDVGEASLVRLTEAQRDLTAAEGRLALARVALRKALEDLEAATGGRPVTTEEDTEDDRRPEE